MAATPIATWVKDPSAVLDYGVGFRKWLKGDRITSIVVTADAGLTVDSTTFNRTGIVAWFSGGVDGTNYYVVYRVTTAGGRTDDRSVLIQVRSR